MLRFFLVALLAETSFAFHLSSFPLLHCTNFRESPVFVFRKQTLSLAVDTTPSFVRTAVGGTDSRGEISQKYADLIKKPALTLGDVSIFLIFAAIGRMNHGSSEGSLFVTAAPFILSWLTFAPILNGFKDSESWREAITSIILPLAAALPSAIMLRGLLQGHVAAPSFWVVTFVVTTSLLSAWRLLHFQLSVVSTTVDKFVEAIVEDDE